MNDATDWHFLNIPFVTGPIQSAIDSINTNDNIVWAIQNAIATLSASNSTTLDKSLHLRFLIHFLGDIHQPLHVLSQFSPLFPPPVGDQGGNLFPIQGAFVEFLHPFIDSGAGQWTSDPVRPLSPENATAIANIAVQIMQEFPQ
jgi:S1/P1 Nuclease